MARLPMVGNLVMASGVWWLTEMCGPSQVILMAGLQGVGKTTACGKLALYLQKQGKKVHSSSSGSAGAVLDAQLESHPRAESTCPTLRLCIQIRLCRLTLCDDV